MSFSGYASLFGIADSTGDIVMPGAFRESLARRGRRGIRMLFQHDPDRPLGVWTDIREDTRGLFVEGELCLRPAGASFVRLNEAVTQLAMRSADLGLTIDWRIGPASRNLGDAAYREETTSLSGLALRPLAPCQLRARRSGDDVLFSWIRQTRLDGDSWELAEVPLGEESEQYELTIYDAGTVRRSLSLAQAFYRYSREDQLADFGTAPAVFTISIAQRSAAYGLGARAEATLHV